MAESCMQGIEGEILYTAATVTSDYKQRGSINWLRRVPLIISYRGAIDVKQRLLAQAYPAHVLLSTVYLSVNFSNNKVNC